MISRFLLIGFGCLFVTGLAAQRYQRLHAKAVLVDTHNDFPSASIEKKLKFDEDLNGKSHTDLNRMRQGGIDVQVFSIFCGPEQALPYAFANRQIDSVYEWVRRSPLQLSLVKTPAELKQAIRDKKMAAMLGVEGGHMIEDRLENLERLYERGVRYMTITWNNSTAWASSAADESTRGDSLPHKGLTDFGRQVIRRMNELGMIVDVSHTGEQTFRDIIATSTKPVIASHSCVWNITPHRRNLKDEQIRAIARNGGVIHLNFYAGFIDSSYERKLRFFLAQHRPEVDSLVRQNIQPDYAQMMVMEKYPEALAAIRPPLTLLLDHLDYIVRLVGVNHVGLGSDFDGIEAPPKELNGVQDFPFITKALLERGYSKKDIRKIMGENFQRVFRANQRQE